MGATSIPDDLDWNTPSIRFCESLGGKILEQWQHRLPSWDGRNTDT
jgi:hypothetical protein